jgi:hypothetical protein
MDPKDGAKRRAGWKPWTSDEAEVALRLWEESGQTAKEFGEVLGVSGQQLRTWRRKLGHGVVLRNGL